MGRLLMNLLHQGQLKILSLLKKNQALPLFQSSKRKVDHQVEKMKASKKLKLWMT